MPHFLVLSRNIQSFYIQRSETNKHQVIILSTIQQYIASIIKYLTFI